MCLFLKKSIHDSYLLWVNPEQFLVQICLLNWQAARVLCRGCDLYLIEPYCVSVLAFPNAVHNFWRDSMKAILGNAFIAIKEYQMKVAPFAAHIVLIGSKTDCKPFV